MANVESEVPAASFLGKREREIREEDDIACASPTKRRREDGNGAPDLQPSLTEDDRAARLAQMLLCAAQAGFADDIFPAAVICKGVYNDRSLWAFLSRFRAAAVPSDAAAGLSKGLETQGRLFYNGRTPLMAAARFGNAARLEWLRECFPATSLTNGSSHGSGSGSGSSSSSSSSPASTSTSVRIVDAPDFQGRTALHWAAEEQRPEMICLLLSKGRADLNRRDINGQTPLHISCTKQALQCVEALLTTGTTTRVLTNLRDHQDRTPWELSSTSTAIQTLLIEHGARPSDPIEAFKVACELRSDDKAFFFGGLLIEKGHINAAGCVATRAVDEEYELYLEGEEKGEEEKSEGIHWWKKVQYKHAALASKRGHVLLPSSSSSSASSSSSSSSSAGALLPRPRSATPPKLSDWPLLIAIERGRADLALKLLEDPKADPNLASRHGQPTPLTRAVEKGMTAVVERLLERGADIEAPGGDDEANALHIACENGYVDIARLLLAKGADPNQRSTIRRESPLYACLTWRGATSRRPGSADADDNDELFHLLVASGADPKAPFQAGDATTTLASTAVLAGSIGALGWLLDHAGAALEPPFLMDAICSNIPGHAAAAMAHFLLDRGLDPLSPDCVDEERQQETEAKHAEHSSPLTKACKRACLIRLHDDEKDGPNDSEEAKSEKASLREKGAAAMMTVVTRLLDAGLEPFPCDAREGIDYSLQIAAKTGNEELTALLLAQDGSADAIDHQGQDGKTALWRACEGGHAAVALMLLAKGADPNICDDKHMSPLQHAASKGRADVVRALLEGTAAAGGKHSLDIDYRYIDPAAPNQFRFFGDRRRENQKYWSALGIALDCGCEEAKARKDSAGDSSSSSGGALEGYRATIELLVDHFANHDSESTGLNEKSIQVALRAGAQAAALTVFKRDLDDRATKAASGAGNAAPAPLLFGVNQVLSPAAVIAIHVDAALDCGAPAVAASMLLHAASLPDPALKEKAVGLAERVFEMACASGMIDSGRALLEQLEFKPTEPTKQKLLRQAAAVGNVDVLRLLLSLGVDADAKDEAGITALMLAVIMGRSEVVKLLMLEGQADPNARSVMGRSALSFGLMGRQIEATEALFRPSDDPMAAYKAVDVVTPLLTTSAWPYGAVESDLSDPPPSTKPDFSDDKRKDGTNDSFRSNMVSSWPPLHLAADMGMPTIVIALLESGAPVHALDHRLCTALHVAARKGHVRSLKAMLAFGADPNVRNGAEETPLLLAASARSLACCKALVDAGADLSARDLNGRTALLRCLSPLDLEKPDERVAVYLASVMPVADFAATDDKDKRTNALTHAKKSGLPLLAFTMAKRGATSRAQALFVACRHKAPKLICELLDDASFPRPPSSASSSSSSSCSSSSSSSSASSLSFPWASSAAAQAAIRLFSNSARHPFLRDGDADDEGDGWTLTPEQIFAVTRELCENKMYGRLDGDNGDMREALTRLLEANSGPLPSGFLELALLRSGSEDLARRILHHEAGRGTSDCLRWAIVKGNARLAVDIMGLESSPDSSALQIACEHQAISTVMRLLALGVKPTQADLLTACEAGNPLILRAILKRGACHLNLNAGGEPGKEARPIQAALTGGHAEAALVLLGHRVPEHDPPEFSTGGGAGGDHELPFPFGNAIVVGNAQVGSNGGARAGPAGKELELNVSGRFAVERTHSCTALHLACRHGMHRVVRAVLATGASTEAPGLADEETSLETCVEGGQLHCMMLLLKAGANPDGSAAGKAKRGTPLHRIARALVADGSKKVPRKTLLSMAEVLLVSDADPDCPWAPRDDDNDNKDNRKRDFRTPLALAVETGDYEFARKLLELGASLQQPQPPAAPLPPPPQQAAQAEAPQADDSDSDDDSNDDSDSDSEDDDSESDEDEAAQGEGNQGPKGQETINGSLLEVAVGRDDAPMVRLLLECRRYARGASLPSPEELKRLLLTALKDKGADVVARLLSAIDCIEGKTALLSAVLAEYLTTCSPPRIEKIKLLLAHGADPTRTIALPSTASTASTASTTPLEAARAYKARVFNEGSSVTEDLGQHWEATEAVRLLEQHHSVAASSSLSAASESSSASSLSSPQARSMATDEVAC